MEKQFVHEKYGFVQEVNMDGILQSERESVQRCMRRNRMKIEKAMKIELDEEGLFVDVAVEDIEVIISSDEVQKKFSLESFNWLGALEELADIALEIKKLSEYPKLYADDPELFYSLGVEGQIYIKSLIIKFINKYGFLWADEEVTQAWVSRYQVLHSQGKGGQILARFFSDSLYKETEIIPLIRGKSKNNSPVMLLDSFLSGVSLAYGLYEVLRKLNSSLSYGTFRRSAMENRTAHIIDVAELSHDSFRKVAQISNTEADVEIDLSPALLATEFVGSKVEEAYKKSLTEQTKEHGRKNDEELQKLSVLLEEELFESLAQVFFNQSTISVLINEGSMERHTLKKDRTGSPQYSKTTKFKPLMQIKNGNEERRPSALIDALVVHWLAYMKNPKRIRRCERCNGLFVQQDKRQRFCPPIYGEGKSQCGQNFRQGKRRDKKKAGVNKITPAQSLVANFDSPPIARLHLQ